MYIIYIPWNFSKVKSLDSVTIFLVLSVVYIIYILWNISRDKSLDSVTILLALGEVYFVYIVWKYQTRNNLQNEVTVLKLIVCVIALSTYQNLSINIENWH